MSGPLVLVVVGVLIFLIRRHTDYIGRAWAGIIQTVGTGDKEKSDKKKEKEVGWLEKYRGSVLVTVWGGTLFYWSLQHPKLNGTQIGELSQTYWIQILIVWGVVAFLIWLNTEKPIAAQLQKISFWTVITLLILLPSWSWITSPSQSSGARAGIQKTGCMMPFTERSFTDHPAFGPDGGYSAKDKWLPLRVQSDKNSCLVEKPKGGHIEWDSDNPSIYDLELSCVYERGGTGSVRIDGCKGGVITAEFVHNPTDAPVTVWYAYARN